MALRETRWTRIAGLMMAVAVSLAVTSGLHLAGSVHGRSSSFDPDAAGVAEAVIGVVLAAAALWMLNDEIRARAVGIGANGFALAGFLVGISETARGGDIPDIAYHSSVIPILVLTLVALVRGRSPSAAPPAGRPGQTRSSHRQAA